MNKERKYKEKFWEMVSEYVYDREYAPCNVDYRRGKIAGFFAAVSLLDDEVSADFYTLVSNTTCAVVMFHPKEDEKLA